MRHSEFKSESRDQSFVQYNRVDNKLLQQISAFLSGMKQIQQERINQTGSLSKQNRKVINSIHVNCCCPQFRERSSIVFVFLYVTKSYFLLYMTLVSKSIVTEEVKQRKNKVKNPLFASLVLHNCSVRINLPLFSTVLPSNSCFCLVGLPLLIQHFQNPQDPLKMLY